MRMMRLARAVIASGLIVGVSAGVAQDDHETTVRLAYAKLAFICQIGGIREVGFTNDAPADAQRRLQQHELRFTIKDLRTGKLGDLKKSSLRFSSLVTPLGPPVLRVLVGNWSHKTPESESSAMIADAKWQDQAPPGPEDWSMPAGNAIELIDPKNRYSEYAAFEVVVEAAQRSRAYRAAFLFGTDDRGQPDAHPLDSVVGAGPLLAVVKKSVVPGPVLDPFVPRHPLSELFLKYIRIDTDCKMEPDGKVCCDLQKLRCGIR